MFRTAGLALRLPSPAAHLLLVGSLIACAAACSGDEDSEATSARLRIEGASTLRVEGPQGGPFPDTTLEIGLSNAGDVPLAWHATATADWVTISTASGSLVGGAEAVVLLGIDAEHAALLAVGSFQASVEFYDETAGASSGTVIVMLGVSVSDWTLFAESPDTRKVYVSKSSGNDGNDGLTPDTPKRSIAAGKALLRNGFPDWLLLEAGGTWEESLGQWRISGRSEGERLLISSYGSSPERPFLRTGNHDGITAIAEGSTPASVDHVAIVGLHFQAHTYSGDGEPGGVVWLIEATDLLVEDCLFEGYEINISVPGSGGRKRGVRIRRNVIVDAFSTGGTIGHGIYMANCDDVLIEGNLLDHNGWNENVPGAVPTIFRHGIYIQGGSGTCTGVVVRDNIIANSASHGLQLRPGGLVEGNLFLRNSIGLLLGGGNEPNPGGVDVECLRNVFLDAKDIDEENPRGWAIEAQNLAAARIVENLIAHRSGGNFPISIDLHASINGIGVFDTLLAGNVVYGWGGPLQLEGGPDLFSTVELSGNQFDDTASPHALLRHFDSATTSVIQSANNRFFSSMVDPSAWILIGGVDHSVASWGALVGDATSFAAPDDHPDPTRTIETYDALIGGNGSLAGFLAVMRTQSRANWRPEYTAPVANLYFRAGFGLP